MGKSCIRCASLVALTYFATMIAGCAGTSAERQRVETIAERRIDCPSGRFSIDLSDEGTRKRTWTARCDFHAIRVNCTDEGCSEEVERLRMYCEWPPELWSSGNAAGAAGLVTIPP